MSDLPTVSVLVVNLNGRGLLAECLDSIIAQDYPSNRVEIILVDNASTDGSAGYIREAYPSVRVVEAGRNLGFAGGNNLGAQLARGEVLALVNNDARADSRWLRSMAEMLHSASDIACVASKILDQTGQTIDFVGTAMNLYGRAFQIDEGLPHLPDLYDKPCELLAPCGGGMMIPRDLFHQIGGFDSDYLAYYEDVDLGWRLWLQGHRVLLAPQAIIYHRQHQTGAGFPVEQRYTLSEVNALRTLIKNLEDKNLWQVLSFSLFMGVKRSMEQANLDRHVYRLGYPASGDAQSGVFESEPRMTRVATAFLVAIEQVAEEMPHLMEKRRQIQAARVRSDEEIFERFPTHVGNPVFPWRRYHVAQDNLVAELGLSDTLKPRHGQRLLMITQEAIGPRMTAAGARAWEIACALSEHFDLILAAPGETARKHPGLQVVGYEVDRPQPHGLVPHIANADAVLATGSLYANIPQLQDLGKPSIVDLSDLFPLEELARARTGEQVDRVSMDVESRLALLLTRSVGDFYICANERQRDFCLGTLMASGRLNAVTYAQDPTLRALIDVVPPGLPAGPPSKQRSVLKGVLPGIRTTDKVLICRIGQQPRPDLRTLVDGLAQVLSTRTDVKLFCCIDGQPEPEEAARRSFNEEIFEQLAETGLLGSHLFLGEPIPYDERGDYLLEADLGLSIHQTGVDTDLAPRAWLLDCIWAGLPVLTTAGDPVSEMIDQRGLGRALPPERPDLLAQAVLEMLDDETARTRATGESKVSWSELTWAQSVQPVVAFLRRSAFAPDALEAARKAVETRQISTRIRSLEAELASVKQNWLIRVLLRVKRAANALMSAE